MKYRCRIELAADLLTACLKAEKKTHIMNHGNINFKQLTFYLKMLLKSDLLSFEDASNSYVITKKGKKFLDLFNDYKQHANEHEKKLRIVNEKRNQLEHMFLLPNVS